jgi:hypothetical protein
MAHLIFIISLIPSHNAFYAEGREEQISLHRIFSKGIENRSEKARESLMLRDCQILMDKTICSWIDEDGIEAVYNISDNLFGWIRSNSTDHGHSALNIAHSINVAESITNTTASTKSTFFQSSLDFPIFVLNNPDREDRLEQLERCLDSVGLVGPRILIPFTREDEIDIKSLIVNNEIDKASITRMQSTNWIKENALRIYLANALDHRRAVTAGADSGFEMFGVFEDDLMVSAQSEDVSMRIKTALSNIPPTADMLYLEGCHEACRERWYSTDNPFWARTAGIFCSAAIIFTLKGARRLQNLMTPIFAGIDDMYNAVIHAGLVEAFVIVPHAFLQDGYWRSGIQSYRGSAQKYGDRAIAGVTHRPFSILCSDDERGDLSLVVTQMSVKSPFMVRVLCMEQQQRDFKVLFISDTLSNNVRADSWRWLVYTARDGERWQGWRQVGRWPQAFGAHGVILIVDEGCQCFHFLEEGACELRVEGTTRAGEKDTHYVHLSHTSFVRRDVHSLDDVLVASFRGPLREAAAQCGGLGAVGALV